MIYFLHMPFEGFERVAPKRVAPKNPSEEGPKLPRQIEMTVSEALANTKIKDDAFLKQIIADWDNLQSHVTFGGQTTGDDGKLVTEIGNRIKFRLAQHGVILRERDGADVTVAAFVEAFKGQ
jgi:hypothetical protein